MTIYAYECICEIYVHKCLLHIFQYKVKGIMRKKQFSLKSKLKIFPGFLELPLAVALY